MKVTSAVLLLAGSLLLGACGAGEDGFVQPSGERMAELKAIVDAADWSKAEEQTVSLDEFKFAPANLVFKRNQPYELTLTNIGGTAHSFVAPGFFDAIAVQGLIFADGEVSMPILQSISLEAKESKILVFVPIKAGEFTLTCDRPLHEIFGMEGSIKIE